MPAERGSSDQGRRRSGPGSAGPSAGRGAGRDGPKHGDRTGRGAPRRGEDRRTGSRTGSRSESRGERPPRSERTEDQTRYDGPDLPEEITGAELDRSVLAQLSGLPEKLGSRVARHLAAAGSLLGDDPELAYQHALAAKARAARVAVVREAVGETAYLAQHFAEALAELKAARRMNGATDYLPMMADCERALGRPERALELAKSPSVEKLSQAQQIEMRIVEAGSRFDLGETEGALRTLENARVRSASREAWVARLRYAYADLLLQAGRRDEAMEWFHRTVAVDGEQLTDAEERVAQLEAAGDGA